MRAEPPPLLSIPGSADASEIPVRIVRSPRARRYLLRLDGDGAARLVIPKRGSQAEAMRFLERSRTWLEVRRQRWLAQRTEYRPWLDGTKLLFRGETVQLSVREDLFGVTLSFADQFLQHVSTARDYRSTIQSHLREMAERELPLRTRDLASNHGIEVRRVTIRAQKTRWGSCSSTGTISLNWRLIHAPPFVRDYLIIHELMHRRQMNHSARYWRLVAEAFPRWQEAEVWLKKTRIESLA